MCVCVVFSTHWYIFSVRRVIIHLFRFGAILLFFFFLFVYFIHKNHSITLQKKKNIYKPCCHKQRIIPFRLDLGADWYVLYIIPSSIVKPKKLALYHHIKFPTHAKRSILIWHTGVVEFMYKIRNIPKRLVIIWRNMLYIHGGVICLYINIYVWGGFLL